MFNITPAQLQSLRQFCRAVGHTLITDDPKFLLIKRYGRRYYCYSLDEALSVLHHAAGQHPKYLTAQARYHKTTEIAQLVHDLWHFIENVPEDDPKRTAKFFKLRARYRSLLG